jgi:O-antigen/teichoic acid export membrane protein
MLQLAQGRGRLAVYTNLTAAAVYVPLLIYMVPRYGAMGAALPLLIVYAGKFLIWTHIVHAQVLRQEKWRWYVQDVFIPSTAALVVVLIARWQLPRPLFSKVMTGVPLLGIIVAAGAAAAVASAPLTRMHALALIAKFRRLMARGPARPES